MAQGGQVVVVVPEDVFVPELRAVVVHRPGGGPRPVQIAGDLPGPVVQARVVPGLVQPGAPHDHRRPAAVPDHHVPHVGQHDVLPRRVADMVPAGRFLPHHEAQFVACVEEVRGLRVMRAAHHVAVEVVLDDLGVPPLQAGAGRHADVGEELVPVQAEYLEPLAVQEESVRAERRLPETDSLPHRMRARARYRHGRRQRVQRRAGRGPQGDVAQSGQRQGGGRLARADLVQGAGGAGDGPDAPAAGRAGQLGSDPHRRVRCPGRVDGAPDVDAPVRRQHVDRLSEHIGEISARHDPQPDITVDPGGLQEIDGRWVARDALRRDWPAAAVDDHRQHVVARLQVAGQLGREGQVAAHVSGHRLAVDEHGGVDHHPVEVGQHPAAEQPRAVEGPAVDPHPLPRRRLPLLPGQPRHAVRQGDPCEVGFVVFGLLGSGDVLAEYPAGVERELACGGRIVTQGSPPVGILVRTRRLIAPQGQRNGDRPRRSRPGEPAEQQGAT